MKIKYCVIACSLLLLCSITFAMQQRGQWGRRGYQSADNRNGVPVWDSNQNFPHDVFTFVRVRYSDAPRGYRRSGGDWSTDWPDADLNFSLRLQQLTSIKVNPYPEILDLTDPRLFDYPFLYMIEPGGIGLTPPEIEGLRKYCNNGGFMMVDDFWGDDEWLDFELAMQQVFPNRKWEREGENHEYFEEFSVKKSYPLGINIVTYAMTH